MVEAITRAISKIVLRGSPLRQHADYLKPGRWVAIRPRRTVWHHVNASLPPALVGRAGKATVSALARTPIAAPVSTWRRAKSAAKNALAAKSGSVAEHNERSGDATVLVRVAGSRSDFLALSPGAQATRVGRPGSFCEEYVDVRRRFERHVAAPSFAVSADRSVLTESWCEGPLLSDLLPTQRKPHVVAILGSYAELVSTESVLDHASIWQKLPEMVERAALPAPLATALESDCVRRLLCSRLLSPVQGDLVPENIILDASLGRPVVIDFDTAGWHPIWLDPVRLHLRTSGRRGNREKIGCALDGALNNLWEAAEIDGVSNLSLPECLALVAVAKAWQFGTGKSMFGPVNPEKFSARVEYQASLQLRMIRSEGL